MIHSFPPPPSSSATSSDYLTCTRVQDQQQTIRRRRIFFPFRTTFVRSLFIFLSGAERERERSQTREGKISHLSSFLLFVFLSPTNQPTTHYLQHHVLCFLKLTMSSIKYTEHKWIKLFAPKSISIR